MKDQSYVVVYKGKAVTFYGPFENADAARRASYFSKSVEIQDANSFRLFPFDVEFYDDLEVAAVLDDPRGFGKSSATLKPARLPVHRSWRKLFSDYHAASDSFDDWMDNWWQGKEDKRW